DLNSESYDAFELYDATTTLDGKSGTWRLYYKIDGVRTEVLDAEFDVTSEAVREITFIVPETIPDAGSSTVHYAADGDARLFDWHQEPEDFDHLIEWDEETKAGSITATNYLDGERYCWDENLEDVACECPLTPSDLLRGRPAGRPRAVSGLGHLLRKPREHVVGEVERGGGSARRLRRPPRSEERRVGDGRGVGGGAAHARQAVDPPETLRQASRR